MRQKSILLLLNQIYFVKEVENNDSNRTPLLETEKN